MRIVYLQDKFPPENSGGGAISAYELALAAHTAGHDVFVITTCRDKRDAGEFTVDGLLVYRIAIDYPERWRWYMSLYNVSAVHAVGRLLERIRPDIVHVNNIHHYLSYACLRVAKRNSKGVIFTARDVMTFNYAKLTTQRYLEHLDARTTWRDHIRQAGKRYNPFRNIIIKHYLTYADRIIAISEALRTALRQNGIRCDAVVYNGIRPDAWLAKNDAIEHFREKHGLHGKKVLLFGGRLSEAKGAEKALEALAQIHTYESGALMLVIGEDNWYAKIMREKARELGVADRLVFTGWITGEEIRAAYGAADVVWMLSICFDAFGRVNIEAMSAGKPVVGTCFGGTPEVVEDGVTGYIVNPLHPDEITERTLRLLRNPALAERFGRAGRERVERLFSTDAITKDTLALYSSLLK